MLVSISGQLDPDPDAVAEDENQESEENEEVGPQVVVEPNGLISDFEVTFIGDSHSFIVRSDIEQGVKLEK